MKSQNIKPVISQLYIPGIVAGVGLCIIFAAVSFYYSNGYINIGEDKSRAFFVTAGVVVPMWLIVRLVWFIREIRGDNIGSLEEVPDMFAEPENSSKTRLKTGDNTERRITVGEYIARKIASCTALDIFVCMYALAAVISTLTSEYREVSLVGQPGWNMGLIVQLLMVGMYLMCRDTFGRMFRDSSLRRVVSISFTMMMTISAVVFILGTINRYSIYPIHMLGEAEDFISTIGNINWFCGYWCIWYAVGCGLFLTVKKTWQRSLLGIYILICSLAGISCGASSAYLVAMAVSYGALLWALSDSGNGRAKPENSQMRYMLIEDDRMERKYSQSRHRDPDDQHPASRLERLCVMEIIQLCALPIIRFIGWARPYRMWYDSELLRGITYGDAWLFPFVGGVVFFGLLREFFAWKKGDYSRFRDLCIGIPAGVAAAGIVILILNSSIEGGIWPVRGISAFTWNIRWGNSRGGIWMVTFKILEKMLPSRIFFGVGVDCFCNYAFSIYDISALLNRYIGNQLLTCAHNEILTMLVNEGIFGCAAYLGLICSHMAAGIAGLRSQRGSQNKSERTVPVDSPVDESSGVFEVRKLSLACVLAMFAYIAIGMVGFAQILSTPFFFVIMGAVATHKC